MVGCELPRERQARSLLPQDRTLHIQKHVLPYALC